VSSFTQLFLNFHNIFACYTTHSIGFGESLKSLDVSVRSPMLDHLDVHCVT